MDALLDGLTTAQREAVCHVDGPLLILAGPGSGKTRVVTHRIAHLIGHGIPAWQIAALTFTNKAADEMRMRVNLLAPQQKVWMGTFHRFCAQLLRRYASLVGLSENYSIYDMADSRQAMKRAIEAADVSTTHTSPEQIAAAISTAKNRLITPEMMQNQTHHARQTIPAQVYPVYQQQLLRANAVDFDDLLFHVGLLLRTNAELRAELDAKFRYVLVDEYQDTNLAQYCIVRALSIDHPNLSVTGDPDQSIYGWRGADLNNILDFEKDYPAVKTVRLEQNYRSTPNILRVADQLIRHNRRRKAKSLFTDQEEGEMVQMRLYQDGHEEADDIADQVAAKIATSDARPRDFAVFCRMNALTRSLEHAFRNRGLPYQIINGLEFYQRKEIKDLLAYLHLINNPSNDVALTRIINVPTRGIGAKTVERLRGHADRHRIPMLEAARQVAQVDGVNSRAIKMVGQFVQLYDRLNAKATATLEDLLRYLIEETAYEAFLQHSTVDQDDNSAMENVAEFISASVDYDRMHPDDGSLDGFLEQVALVADTDAFEDSSDRVTLMTLHASKGLEFPHVFVVAVEDDVLPHKRSKDNEDQFEEERRLLFVGITRAKRTLQISFCKTRTTRGDSRPAIPSPFLGELPRDEMRYVESESRHDFFDGFDDQNDFGDPGYPESWDIEGEHDADHVSEPSITDDDVCQLEPAERAAQSSKPTETRSNVGLAAGLRTAADLAAAGSTPLGAYREGVQVLHPEYGAGKILSVTGRGVKRTAKIRFADEEVSVRLAFCQMQLVP
ncbi:MAG: UvrD-helicase domain-containing protein [Planctomycetota bacterium]